MGSFPIKSPIDTVVNLRFLPCWTECVASITQQVIFNDLKYISVGGNVTLFSDEHITHTWADRSPLPIYFLGQMGINNITLG